MTYRILPMRSVINSISGKSRHRKGIARKIPLGMGHCPPTTAICAQVSSKPRATVWPAPGLRALLSPEH